jgi:hypothetical protein
MQESGVGILKISRRVESGRQIMTFSFSSLLAVLAVVSARH